jgi:hypothetical protein
MITFNSDGIRLVKQLKRQLQLKSRQKIEAVKELVALIVVMVLAVLIVPTLQNTSFL